MGNEFGQFIEWRFYEELEWFLLNYEAHGKHLQFVKELNRLYKQQPSLWQQNYTWEGYQWLDADNREQSVLIFKRQAEEEEDFTLILLNFQPDTYHKFKMGVPVSGSYREIFNSDEPKFGGSGHTNGKLLKSQEGQYHGQDQYIEVTVPPIGGMILTYCPLAKG